MEENSVVTEVATEVATKNKTGFGTYAVLGLAAAGVASIAYGGVKLVKKLIAKVKAKKNAEEAVDESTEE